MNPENDIFWTEIEELGGTLPLKVLIPLVSENSGKTVGTKHSCSPKPLFLTSINVFYCLFVHRLILIFRGIH